MRTCISYRGLPHFRQAAAALADDNNQHQYKAAKLPAREKQHVPSATTSSCFVAYPTNSLWLSMTSRIMKFLYSSNELRARQRLGSRSLGLACCRNTFVSCFRPVIVSSHAYTVQVVLLLYYRLLLNYELASIMIARGCNVRWCRLYEVYVSTGRCSVLVAE